MTKSGKMLVLTDEVKAAGTAKHMELVDHMVEEPIDPDTFIGNEVISVLLPTRGRPGNLKRMVNSARQTCSQSGNLEIVAVIDSDDDSYDKLDLDITILRVKKQTLSNYWNLAQKKARGTIYMLCGDDIVFKTYGWDDVVRAKFNEYEDKIVFVYGDDGSPNGSAFGTHGFLHKNWVDAVGYFTPPYFSGDMCDTWLNEIAGNLGRRAYVDILTEHLHPNFNKAPTDEIYQATTKKKGQDKVREIYKSKLKERKEDVKKLQKLLTRPKWSILILSMSHRKKMLERLLGVLEPQLARYPDIELIIDASDSRHVGEKRKRCVERARGEYINFIDDDDLITKDYVAKIYPQLDGTDYVGFKVAYYRNGQYVKPAIHSTKYKKWSSDDKAFYRNVSHLNPIKRSIAVKGPWVRGYEEDFAWAQSVAPYIKHENFIDKELYLYYYVSNNEDREKRE